MIIYGKNSVYEGLIEKVKFDSIYIEKGKREKFRNLINIANENNIPVLFREKKEIEKISRSKKHQGICASLILPDNIVEDENNFELTENIKNILILDGITDTGNLGAIVRSAVLLNCHLLILPRDNSARLTPQTFKASAGAIYKQRIVYVNNINTWISILRENGFFSNVLWVSIIRPDCGAIPVVPILPHMRPLKKLPENGSWKKWE